MWVGRGREGPVGEVGSLGGRGSVWRGPGGERLLEAVLSFEVELVPTELAGLAGQLSDAGVLNLLLDLSELIPGPREGLVGGGFYVEAVRDGTQELEEDVGVRGQRAHGGPTDPRGVGPLLVCGVGGEGVQQVH